MRSTSRRVRHSLRALALTAAFAALAPRTAEAQSGTAASLAETLFDDAIGMMERGDFARACPKLEESDRLDPAGGTRLNLARCYEGAGRVAAAWTTFRDALATARREGRGDRVQFAEERLAALKPRLSRITFAVATTAPPVELVLDELKVGAAAWDSPALVDPGRHRVRATAAGRVPFETTVDVAEGETRAVVIPELAPLRSTAAEPASSAGAPSAPSRAEAPGGTQRTVGWALTGAGAAGVVTATVFGALALVAESTADATCPTTGPCTDPRGLEASERAHGFATVATVSVVIGVASLVTGVVLLLTAPKRPASAASGLVVRF